MPVIASNCSQVGNISFGYGGLPARGGKAIGGGDIQVVASLDTPGGADQTQIYRLTVDNKLYFSDGASWYSLGVSPLMTAPVSGDFAWVNQGSATITAVNGGLFLSAPSSASINFRIRKKSAPATPYTITAFAIPLFFDGGGNPSCGLCFRESSSGKIATCAVAFISNAYSFYVAKFTNETTWSGANYFYTGSNLPGSSGPGIFMRMSDDGVNRISSYSLDGSNFRQLHTIGRTDFITANEVGFYVDSGPGSNPQGMTLLSWIQT